jgi:hypothetical protein
VSKYAYPPPAPYRSSSCFVLARLLQMTLDRLFGCFLYRDSELLVMQRMTAWKASWAHECRYGLGHIFSIVCYFTYLAAPQSNQHNQAFTLHTSDHPMLLRQASKHTPPSPSPTHPTPCILSPAAFRSMPCHAIHNKHSIQHSALGCRYPPGMLEQRSVVPTAKTQPRGRCKPTCLADAPRPGEYVPHNVSRHSGATPRSPDVESKIFCTTHSPLSLTLSVSLPLFLSA